MKNHFKAARITILLALLALGGVMVLNPPRGKGQGAVDQTGTKVFIAPGGLPVCTGINAQSSAVNTTATVTFPAGNIIIYEIDFQVANDATGAVTQANVNFTSTNLGGLQWQYSSANAANTSLTLGPFYYPTGLRASPGTTPTIVSPAINAHVKYTINACYQISNL